MKKPIKFVPWRARKEGGVAKTFYQPMAVKRANLSNDDPPEFE